MRSMMSTVCRHLRNYFPEIEAHEGHFTIENQQISLPFCTEGDYILIEGSKRNDGVIQYTEDPCDFLVDEEFEGRVSIRAIPSDVEEIVSQIDEYMTTHAVPSDLDSESFDGYTYHKVINSKGSISDWQDVFRSRLNPWRKI